MLKIPQPIRFLLKVARLCKSMLVNEMLVVLSISGIVMFAASKCFPLSDHDFIVGSQVESLARVRRGGSADGSDRQQTTRLVPSAPSSAGHRKMAVVPATMHGL